MPRLETHEAHGQRVHLPPCAAAAAVLGSPRTSPGPVAAPKPGTTTPRVGRELGGGGRGGGGSLGSTLDEVRHGQLLSRKPGKMPCRGAGVRGCWCAMSGSGLRSWQRSSLLGEVETHDNCWVRFVRHARDEGSQDKIRSARQGWVAKEERCGPAVPEKAWESRSLS